MAQKANMVDRFLGDAKEKQKAVRLYLTNGHEIEGAIADFDYSSVLVEVKGRPQMFLRQSIVSCSAKDVKPAEDNSENRKHASTAKAESKPV